MKKSVTLMVLVLGGILVAQSANQYSMQTPSGAVTGCPTPVAGANILCSVTDGYYVSANGGAYAKVLSGSLPASGVVSFNGRTGSVLPSNGDYNFTQLTGTVTPAQLPSSLTCNFTGSVSGTGGLITLNSCR